MSLNTPNSSSYDSLLEPENFVVHFVTEDLAKVALRAGFVARGTLIQIHNHVYEINFDPHDGSHPHSNLMRFWKYLENTLQSPLHPDEKKILEDWTRVIRSYYRKLFWYYSDEFNIKLLSHAYKKGDRIIAKRLDSFKRRATLIHNYISQSKNTIDWSLLEQSIEKFFESVFFIDDQLHEQEAPPDFKNTQPLPDSEFGAFQEKVQSIIQSGSSDNDRKGVRERIPKNNNDTVAQAMKVAMRRGDYDIMLWVAHDLLDRIDANYFPPSADNREDFLSESFVDHIPYINGDNPLLMDTIEHGPIVISGAHPYAEAGKSAYIIDVHMPRRKFFKRLVVDTDTMFIGNVTSKKVLGFMNEDFMNPLRHFPLTIKYMQFLETVRMGARSRMPTSSHTQPPRDSSLQSIPPKTANSMPPSEKPTRKMEQKPKSMFKKIWSTLGSFFKK